MHAYETRLKGREEIAEGTMAFRFQKPPGFSFRPGQAIELELIDPASSDAPAARHAFSICSAPCQADLAIATRMRESPFKRTLKQLAIGAPVRIEGPFGSLTLHNNHTRPAVLIAGGIGITPFVSMLRQAANDRLPQRLVLIYSNRRPEDAAFLAELQQLERQNENFRLIATMTQMGKSSLTWPGEQGPVGDAMLRKTLKGLGKAVCYVAGPPVMVEAMREALGVAGVDDEDIRSEEFYGY